MGILEKIDAARGSRGRKSTWSFGGGLGFSQPSFWESDAHRFPLASSFSLTSGEEQIENDFDTYIDALYKSNGVIFSCVGVRQHVFSQARFAWRQFSGGTPGELFGNRELALLERPAPGQTTGNLLARMEVVASLAGNWFGTIADDAGRLGRRATGAGRRMAELRPDWVTIIINSASGDPTAPDAKVVGYLYEPRIRGGGARQAEAVLFQPNEIAHYAPEPDPAVRHRGMSWLTPIIREVRADKAATLHKEKFFVNGATPGIAIKFDKDTDEEAWEEFVDKFKQYHEGAWNAYKTLFLAAGADVETVGLDLKQLDFKQTQGAGESRIAMAAGVHPAILGASEGLQGSTLNEGNFHAARRLVSDKTLRHLWNEAASSLEVLLTPPNDSSRLSIDTRDVAFLHEDALDLAEIQHRQASAIRQLTDAGYNPNAITEFIRSNDLAKLLNQHSGLFSVQLQPPGTTGTVTVTDPELAAHLIADGWKRVDPTNDLQQLRAEFLNGHKKALTR